MKKIEAIVRPGKVADVCAVLESIDNPGLTITEVEGHGTQNGLEQLVRGKTYKVGLLTKVRIEIVVKDCDADEVIDTIQKAAFTGNVGDGKIFVYPVENVVRIRTNERCEAALA